MTLTIERVYPDCFTIIEEAILNTDTPSSLGYHTLVYMSFLTKVLDDNPLYLAAFFEKNSYGER